MSTVLPKSKTQRVRKARQRPGGVRHPSHRGLKMPLPAPGETAWVGLTNWEGYLALDKALEGRGFRVRYLRGVFEIMSISFKHESITGHIGGLVQTYCLWADIDFQTWGSTTQRKEGEGAGEPDGSFSFGLEPQEKPELVIEVGLTSGGIDKLDFWGTLGAKEVWIWENGRLHAFGSLGDGTFQPITESRCIKGLKLAALEPFVVMHPTSRALKAFRAQLEA